MFGDYDWQTRCAGLSASAELLVYTFPKQLNLPAQLQERARFMLWRNHVSCMNAPNCRSHSAVHDTVEIIGYSSIQQWVGVIDSLRPVAGSDR